MIHIETAKKSYDTASITVNTTPSSKGLYFINDAENHGVYGSTDLELVKQIYEYAMEKANAGETINTKDLKRQEQSLILSQEKENSPESEQSVEKDWNKIKLELQDQLQLQNKAAKEREQLAASINEMEENNAPEDVISLAKKIMDFGDEVHKTAQQREKDNILFDDADPVKSSDNSYILYKLENRLLTRANSAFKAGIVKAYDKLHMPLMKLHQYALKNQIESEKAEMDIYKNKLEKYTQKIARKMEKRLEKTNTSRIRNGLEPFPSGTVLYLPREQDKINRLTLTLNEITTSVSRLNKDLEKSKEKHQDRLQYVKDHKAISKNEKIIGKHKKVIYQKEVTATASAPVPTPPIEKPSDISKPEPSSPAPTISDLPVMAPTPEAAQSDSKHQAVSMPVYAPDGSYLGEQQISNSTAQDMAAATDISGSEPPLNKTHENREEKSSPAVPTDPSLFSPVSERFAAAKTESHNGKDLVTAKLLYRSLEQKLPCNSMIEFESNGHVLTANCNEYGDFEMKSYDFEKAAYTGISKDEVIQLFREDPKGFDSAIRDQLGEVLIKNPVEKEIEQDK